MAYYEEKVLADEKLKSTIASALAMAETEVAERYDELINDCGRGVFTWAVRGTHLLKLFEQLDGYTVLKRQKGSWHYIFIYDKRYQTLYAFLSQQRFDKLLKAPFKSQTHYAKSPALANTDLDSFETPKEQLRFAECFVSDPEVDEFLLTDFDSIKSSLGKSVSRYVLVTVEKNSVFKISIAANLVGSDFSLKQSESWTEHLVVTEPQDLQSVPEEFTPLSNTSILEKPYRKDSKPVPKLKSPDKEQQQ